MLARDSGAAENLHCLPSFIIFLLFHEYPHTDPDVFLSPPSSLTPTWKMDIIQTFTIKVVKEIQEGGLP